MNIQEFLDLEDGQEVTLVNNEYHRGEVNAGTTMKRVKGWLDDENSQKFEFINNYGHKQWHFFMPDEVELVKE